MKNKIMKKLFLLISLIISFASYSFAKGNIEIVAVVDDFVISSYDVEKRLIVAIESSGLPYNEEVKKHLMPQVLQVLVDEKLYQKEAIANNIEATPQDLDFAISSLEQKNNLKRGGFKEFLKAKNLPYDAIVDQLKAQIIWNKLVAKKIRPKVSVSDRELQENIERMSSSGISELDLSEIVLPVDDPKDDRKVKSLAQKLYQEILNGADFSLVAREFSRSPTSAGGGNLGWVREGKFSKELYNKVKNLTKGDITVPVRDADGYYILKLNDRRALIKVTSDDSEVGIKHAFVPFGSDVSIKKKEEKAAMIQKESAKINGCEGFGGFAKSIKSEVDPGLLMTQVKSLNENIRNAIQTTPVGRLTPAIKSEDGIHVFMVCEKTEAVPAIAEQDKIKEMLMREKITLQAKRYLRDLRRDAFIEIRI